MPVKKPKKQHQSSPQPPAPAHRWPRRVLAVRMLAAKIAWLDGQPRWQGGRVAWETPGAAVFAPGPADIARAQRTLYKIRRYPHAARAAFGEAEEWWQQRQARLHLAKRLHRLFFPAAVSATMEPVPPDRLTSLLIAEALCPDPLPGPPSRLLLASGTAAASALGDLARDGSLPARAHALAALLLGAITGRASESRHPCFPPVTLPRPYLRRAFIWGRYEAFPEEPALAARLLVHEEGEDLVRRWQQAQKAAPYMSLPPALLREMLDEGQDAAQVVAAAEAVAMLEPLAQRLRARRHELPMFPNRQRRSRIAGELLAQREQSISTFAALIQSCVRRGKGDARTVPAIARFVHALLGPGPVTTVLVEMILTIVREGTALPTLLQPDFFDLVVERQGDIWNKGSLPKEAREDWASRHFGAWLRERWEKHGTPLRKVLEATGDAALVREAAGLGLLRLFAVHGAGWDAERYRFLQDVLRRFAPEAGAEVVRCLFWALGGFASTAQARQALRPLLGALSSLPPAQAAHLLALLLNSSPQTRKGRQILPRLARYVPLLKTVLEKEHGAEWEQKEVGCACHCAVEAALVLDRTVPDEAAHWTEDLLDSLFGPASQETPTAEQRQVLPLAVSVALALADGERGRFLAFVRAVLGHPPSGGDRERIERGVAALETYPGLRVVFARHTERQPRRCLALLSRIGMATHLGADVLAPLAECRFASAEAAGAPFCASDDPQWQEVLDLAPEQAAFVGAYWYACWLLGRTPEVPAGVRSAREETTKREAERAYLEEECLRFPERADLRARRDSLRARLGDTERLRATLRTQVCERLEQITAEAQLFAAEQQVSACYRARLESVAGPLPAGLALGTDLENAALLSATITKNRRLLGRLLRAHLAGDHWHGGHPANAAFREKLEAAGVDVAAWLGAHPRRVRCPGVAGGWLHLRLETDPLRVLQMGNYFGTCLSADDFNAYSTVANAVEQNKRVLYATDAAGRVVGRKLVGLDAQGKLVGFHTYTGLGDETANAALREAVRRYLCAFARRCGLERSDSGTVPTLFAEDWYDDGATPWDAQEMPKPARSPKRMGNAPQGLGTAELVEGQTRQRDVCSVSQRSADATFPARAVRAIPPAPA